jgi:nicotinamidase-related amidase
VHLQLRSQAEAVPGCGTWVETLTAWELPPQRLAVCLCDLWDDHWCSAAARRVAALAPEVDRVLTTARDRGATIIHAPSETLDFYAGHPARVRARAVPRVPVPPSRARGDVPLPVDASDGGCDSGEPPWRRAWTRQHPAVRIADGDFISDEGAEVYAILRAVGAECLALLGVHTNMCILNRSFGIRQMVGWGVRCVLVRDLTDAMYNPARPPHVPHERGTELVVEYIERHWCPSIHSRDLLA